MRILTYNIKFGDQTTPQYNMSELAGVISGANADVICVQEVYQNDPAHGPVDMLEGLRSALGMDGYVFGLNHGSYLGNGIIYNGTLLQSENTVYVQTVPVTEQSQGALKTVIKLRGNTVTVISTHLSTGSQTNPAGVSAIARAAQLDELKAITDAISGPLVIAGDFNHTSVAASYATADLYWNRTSRVSAPPVIPANNQDRDHIYMKGNITCKQTFIIDNHSATGGASDHQPVWADIGSYGTGSGSPSEGLAGEII